ncbi:rod shape-determining protein MreC [Marivirga sp. S37H4]|uniref:Cell shape-determining protein MreC n=1 Tax=Marivirga aurantiaca TaxID=2802615 RepID=A0A935C923_9BACT|nr:rod shape-determining protein MreC [Marivirga aurantiaca]MBK6265931.1 rod shape-determining protein MreC [Marivirga aurantiaca]
MRRLFQFIYQYRAFFVFLMLELISGWLVVNHNDYISASYFNSSSALAGNIYNSKQSVQDYFQLKEVNQNLAQENEKLRNTLALSAPIVDSTEFFTPIYLSGQYEFTIAKVVNNSVSRFRNYFTLNKGSKNGIKEGMGVVNPNGIVGKIKSVSENFSTGYSALNGNLLISAVIAETETLCTANWDGKDPTKMTLKYVPRHVKVETGMDVVTSGFNALFPADVKIGEIETVVIEENATFYDITLHLSVDFQSLDYVYVIGNQLQQEKDSLEQTTFELIND